MVPWSSLLPKAHTHATGAMRSKAGTALTQASAGTGNKPRSRAPSVQTRVLKQLTVSRGAANAVPVYHYCAPLFAPLWCLTHALLKQHWEVIVLNTAETTDKRDQLCSTQESLWSNTNSCYSWCGREGWRNKSTCVLQQGAGLRPPALPSLAALTFLLLVLSTSKTNWSFLRTTWGSY